MKKIQLEPIRDNPEITEALKKDILRALSREVYRPLEKALAEKNQPTVKNSKDALVDAIRTGKVRYDGVRFTGTLDASVSSTLRELGAVWRRRGWVLLAEKLPMGVRQALKDADASEAALRVRLDTVLRGIDPQKIADAIDSEKNFSRTEADVSQKFLRSVRKLSVQPTLSKHETVRIRQEYTENLRLSIRSWLDSEILRLRRQVAKHVFEGNRYDSLEKVIQQAKGVGERKARFLARQETNLLTAKLKEVRYESAGIEEYYWRAVQGTPAHPVRPLHQKLSDESKAGKTFRFSSPPISGTKGEHQNPGEPYGCRCIAVPVVRLK